MFGIEVVGFRMHGVRSRVYGARELRFIFRFFWVWDLGFGVLGSGFMVKGLGIRVYSLGFIVSGSRVVCLKCSS